MVAAKKQLPGSRAPCSLQSIEVILGLSLLLVPFTLVLLLLLFPRAVASCGNSILPLRVALAAAAAAVHGSAWSFFHRSASHLRQMPRCILKLGRLCFCRWLGVKTLDWLWLATGGGSHCCGQKCTRVRCARAKTKREQGCGNVLGCARLPAHFRYLKVAGCIIDAQPLLRN